MAKEYDVTTDDTALTLSVEYGNMMCNRVKEAILHIRWETEVNPCDHGLEVPEGVPLALARYEQYNLFATYREEFGHPKYLVEVIHKDDETGGHHGVFGAKQLVDALGQAIKSILETYMV